jgi:serine protease DegQ
MVFGRLALSIPSNAASAWLAGAKEHRPRLGVQILPVEVPPFVRRTNPETPEAGMIITAIEEGSPAERAGLLVGDVLLGVGDEAPRGVEALLDASVGDAVRLRAMRGGKISFVDVNLGASERTA